MATDAEVKLNFRAETEEVKTQLAALKALIDGMAEALKGLGVDGATPIPEETLSLIRELTAEVERLRGSYASLQTQFLNLQEVNAGMSTNFIAQIAALSKAVDEARDKCSELYKTISEQNDKLDGQNERIKELEKRLKELPRTGVSGFRSLRTVVGNFIIQLFNGKLAVKELAVALKGLAYSSVVLGAIQLAMDGIMWAWKGIKSLFGESKEQMKEAEDAAKRAQEELANAKKEAEDAAKRVRELQDKLAEKEAAESLKETLAGITAEYVAQRDAVQSTLAAVKEEARVKARERALQEMEEMGQLDTEMLDLRERFALGKIDEGEFKRQKAEIELRKRDAKRVAEVDKAEIEAQAAERAQTETAARRDRLQSRVGILSADLRGYVSPEQAEIELGKANSLIAKRNAVDERYQQLKREFEEKFGGFGAFQGDNFVFKDGYGPDSFLQGNLNLWYDPDELKRMMDELDSMRGKRDTLRKDALGQIARAKTAKDSAENYKKTSGELDTATKELEKANKEADQAERTANQKQTAFRETLQRTSLEGGIDERRTRRELAVSGLEERRKKQEKEDSDTRKKRDRLQGDVDKLVRNATKAIADTPTDFKDDRRAFDAIGKFLEDNADAVKQYGVNVSSLLDVTRKLVLAFNGAEQQRARMAAEIASLKSSVDQLNKYRNKK